MAKINLFEADIDVEGIIKKSVELRNEMVDLRQEQKILKMTVGETNEEYIKTEARLKKVSAEYSMNQKQVSNLSESSKEFLTVEQKLTTALDKEVASISSATANNSELKKIRNEVNAKTVEGQAAIAEINKKLNENTNFIKSNLSELEQQKVGIGDYKNQIKEAYGELDIMNGGLVGFISRSQQAGGVGALLTKSIKGITTGIYGMVKASLTFLATPIGIFLGAIGLVLGIVVNYLKSTQDGMDKLTAVTRPLSAVFQSLLGVLQKLGKVLIDTFSNPKQAMTDLYDFVKTNLINRFKAFGVILDGIINLDFKKIGNGVAQGVTGVEDVIGKVQTAADKTGKFFGDAIKKGQEIDKLTKQIEQSEINLNKERAISQTEIKKLQVIAKDTSLDANKRVTAQEEITRLTQEEADKEGNIIKLKIERTKIEQTLNDTQRTGFKELADLEAELETSKQKGLDAEIAGLRVTSAAKKEAAAQAKAAAQAIIDDAINLQKQELDFYIASKGTKSKTLQEDLKIAQDVSTKRIDILKAELSAKKITQTEYDTELLNIKNELIQKQAEITTDAASRELQDYIQQHQNKIDNDIFFSAESLRIEQERLDGIATKQKEFVKTQLEQGVINQTAYNDAIKAVDEETRIAKEEAQLLRDEAEKEKKIVDLENSRLLREEEFQNEFVIQSERLEAQRLQEVANAEKTGADVNLINKKYVAYQKSLDQQIADFKEQINGQIFGSLKSLFGESSQLGKLFAVGEIVNNTAMNAGKAFAQAAVFASNPLTAPLAVNANIQGGIIIATGAAQIAKTVIPKAERGATFMIGGKDHSQGGTIFYDGFGNPQFEAQKNERMFILNRQASASLEPLLSDINQQYGGVALSNHSAYLASGGQVARNNYNNSNQNINVDTSGIKEAVYQGSKEGIQTANIKVKPSEIIDFYNENQAVVNGANR